MVHGGGRGRGDGSGLRNDVRGREGSQRRDGEESY